MLARDMQQAICGALKLRPSFALLPPVIPCPVSSHHAVKLHSGKSFCLNSNSKSKGSDRITVLPFPLSAALTGLRERITWPSMATTLLLDTLRDADLEQVRIDKLNVLAMVTKDWFPVKL